MCGGWRDACGSESDHDRREIARARLAGSCDRDPVGTGDDGELRGKVVAADCRVVPRQPLVCAGGSVVGEGGEVISESQLALTASGDDRDGAIAADRDRGAEVVADPVGWPVVRSGPLEG